MKFHFILLDLFYLEFYIEVQFMGRACLLTYFQKK